jgi:hypothetical protein
MLKKILLLLIIPYASSYAQEKDSISLDLLTAPTSVAFNLLGVSQSDIERPTDLTSFALSIRNATNNFTRFPSNYAGEFAPGWLSRKSNLTLNKFNSKKFGDVFWQTFSVSFGYSKQDAEEKESDDPGAFTRTGIGFKFSFVRPTWTGETEKAYRDIVSLQTKILHDVTLNRRDIQHNDGELQRLEAMRRSTGADTTIVRPVKIVLMHELDQLITARKQAINDSIDKVVFEDDANYKSLTVKASSFKVERIGPFLDFSSGMVVDFPEEKFSNATVSKAGAWLTGGYEGGNKVVSVLGIVRYLFQPDKIFADDAGLLKSDNISTLDGGARLVIKGARGRFNASTEAIYRSVLNTNTIDPSWRLVFNAEYDIGMNKKLTFAFGKQFDRTITKGGNLITALNFITGFGNKRKLN